MRLALSIICRVKDFVRRRAAFREKYVQVVMYRTLCLHVVFLVCQGSLVELMFLSGPRFFVVSSASFRGESRCRIEPLILLQEAHATKP